MLNILSLAYPFACVCFLVWYFFLRWSPNPWCEQTRRFLGIIRVIVMLLSCFGHGSWCSFEQLLSYHFFLFATPCSMSTLKLSLWSMFCVLVLFL